PRDRAREVCGTRPDTSVARRKTRRSFNLGKLMRFDGVSFRSLLSLRRLHREVDRTLELAPDYADALVGKAALLYYSPRVLGGDPAEGERLLRAALWSNPTCSMPASASHGRSRIAATGTPPVRRRGRP